MEELESKITDRTKMVVIISPNNPTGGVLGRETLEKLADIAIRHDLYVISDEIYEKLIFDGEKHKHCISSGNEGTHHNPERFFQGILHDRVASGLYGSSKGYHLCIRPPSPAHQYLCVLLCAGSRHHCP